MENPSKKSAPVDESSNESKPLSLLNRLFDLPIFVERVLKTAFILFVFGGVYIVLNKWDVATDHIVPPEPQPIAFAAGAAILVVLTVLGVPMAPAAVAGIAIWLLIQKYFPFG